MSNRLYPQECRHVRDAELAAIEEVRFTTIGPVDDDYRYEKGPDVVRICAYCAGRMLATMMGSL